MLTSLSKASKKLLKIEDYLHDKIKRDMKNDFIEKFVLCELVYKSLLSDYLKKHGTAFREEALKLDMRVIPTVLSDSGIIIDKTVLDRLFSSQGIYAKRGSMSLKKLRDSITHSLLIESIDEVCIRSTELVDLMDNFLRHFR